MTALPIDEEFKDWKLSHFEEETWTEYRARMWKLHIDRYLSLGWSLIPCEKREKWPEKGANWKTKRWTREELLVHVTHPRIRGNLAVNAGESGLVVCDYDSKELPASLSQLTVEAPSMETPKGFAFLTRPPSDELLFQRLLKVSQSFDVPRGEGMYEVVPMSETCSRDSKGAHKKLSPDHRHDFRVRKWVLGLDSLRLNIPSFKEFVEMATA